jgi:hypothetical protein
MAAPTILTDAKSARINLAIERLKAHDKRSAEARLHGLGRDFISSVAASRSLATIQGVVSALAEGMDDKTVARLEEHLLHFAEVA